MSAWWLRSWTISCTDAFYLSTAFGVDNSKARKELGWQPRPMVETVRDSSRGLRSAEVADIAWRPLRHCTTIADAVTSEEIR
jgi:hypothetical protein